MELSLVPLYVAIFYGVFLFITSSLVHNLKRHSDLVIDITAGLMFSYLFITLLPDIFDSAPNIVPISAFILFVGYIGFYLAEKHMYSKVRKGNSVRKALFAIRQGGIHIVHFFTGFVIVFTFTESNLARIFLVLIPFTFHIFATTFMYEDMRRWVKDSIDGKFLLPFLIVVGASCALVIKYYFGIPLLFFYAFFGGTLIYLTTTLLNPRHKHAPVTFFIFGVFMYFLLLLAH